MMMHFVNILVPVNLHRKDDGVIALALQMAEPRFCVIHLVAVVRPNILVSMLEGSIVCQEVSGIGLHRFVKNLIHMSELKAIIETRRPGAFVKTHICRSHNFQEAIAWYANRLAAQVVIMSAMENKRMHLFRRSVSPENIANWTNCKVLAYKHGVLSVYEKSDLFIKCSQYANEDQRINTIGNYFAEN